MAYIRVKLISLIMAIWLLTTLMTGCIGPQETIDRLGRIMGGEEEWGWKNRLSIREEEFTLLDIFSPLDQWPFFVKEDAKYVWIYMDVTFSNPVREDWNFLNQGRVNITFIDPLDQRFSYFYSTGLRGSDINKNMVFISQPVSGQWNTEVKAYGTGSYTIKVEAFQSEA